MDNKLSELSKPVAWPNGCNETAVNALRYLAENKRPICGSAMYNTEHLYMISSEVERMSSQHLYSQEYVSALLAELEASKKSNAFLKEQLSQLANFNPDWDMLEACRESWREVSAALKEAETRLATPVRLPDVLFIGRYPVPLMRAEQVKERISAAGFTAEGDE
ncbi:MAG: hypothetical protein ACTINL_03805 [Serratia proteamaculans]